MYYRRTRCDRDDMRRREKRIPRFPKVTLRIDRQTVTRSETPDEIKKKILNLRNFGIVLPSNGTKPFHDCSTKIVTERARESVRFFFKHSENPLKIKLK